MPTLTSIENRTATPSQPTGRRLACSLRVLHQPVTPPRFRPFFVASLLTGTLAGAAWGVAMLVQAMLGQRLTSVSIHQVNAHGHAQLFGFVTLMVVGFAYEAFPRLWSTPLPAPGLRRVVLAASIVGVPAHVAGWWLGTSGTARGLSFTGGTIETVALACFAAQVLCMRARSNARFGMASLFIVVAVTLLVFSAVADTVYSAAVTGVGNQAEKLSMVSSWQMPIRNLQSHGAMLLIILGVGMQMLPRMFSLDPVPASRQAWVFGLLVAGLAGESLAFILLRQTGDHRHAASLYLAWIGIAVAALTVVASLKPWRTWPVGVGNDVFAARLIRAALLWLPCWALLLLAMPVYRWLSGLDFSHAYYGATRHALAGGFATFMMLGFARQVVSSALGLLPDHRSPRRASTWAFAALAVGSGGHVALRLLADLSPIALSLLPLFASLELVGIAWIVAPLLRRLGTV